MMNKWHTEVGITSLPSVFSHVLHHLGAVLMRLELMLARYRFIIYSFFCFSLPILHWSELCVLQSHQWGKMASMVSNAGLTIVGMSSLVNFSFLLCLARPYSIISVANLISHTGSMFAL